MTLKIFFTTIFIVFFQLLNQVNFKYQNINYQRIFKNPNIVYYEVPSSLVSKLSKRNTDLINNLLKRYKTVKLPNTSILIDSRGISLNSGNILIFDKETQIKMDGNSFDRYEILRIHNVHDIEVYNPTIIGDRLQHTGKSGEWGHGISILSSKNIKVYNYKISNCWGDGLYIGKTKNSSPSNSIYLYDGFLDYNRRNGLSITSGTNIKINNLLTSNTHGTLPMYGIDIEPNNELDEVNNILIDNYESVNNFEGGLDIVLHKMKKAKEKEVNISVNNFKDSSSKIGLRLSFILKDFKGLKGLISFKNIELKNNYDMPIKIMRQENSNLKINFDKIILNNQMNMTEAQKSLRKYKNFINVNIAN